MQALQNSAKAGGTHTRTREEAMGNCFLLARCAGPHPHARGGDALGGWFGWEIISYPVGGILILAQISLRLPVQLPHEICPLPGPPVGWSPNRVRVLLLEPIEEEEKVE